MFKISTLLRSLIITTFFATAGCGDRAGIVIKNGPAGPNTGDLIDPLPEGLVPDKTNARHSATDLKPDIN